jgi:hypothetical protein
MHVVDDLRFTESIFDVRFPVVEFVIAADNNAAAEAFVNGRLPAREFVALEVPLSRSQQRQLVRALGLLPFRLGEGRACGGCVARRPRQRQGGTRRRGACARQRARDGDGDGGGGDGSGGEGSAGDGDDPASRAALPGRRNGAQP